MRKTVCKKKEYASKEIKHKTPMPMDETHKVLAGRERIRTPFTHGEGVRHPRTLDNVDLSILNLLVCDIVACECSKMETKRQMRGDM